MPAPLIAAGAALAGQGINAFVQSRQNKKNRQFAEKQYQIQKQDNLDFWQMQNEYNHPSSQMARMKDAGLNPHLMYGQGDVGNAGNIQTPSQARWEGKAPMLDTAGVQGAIHNYFDVEMKKAQVDNLREQNNLLIQEGILKSLGIDTDKLKLENLGYDVSFNRQTLRDRIRGEISKADRTSAEVQRTFAQTDLSRSQERKTNTEQRILYDYGIDAAALRNGQLRLNIKNTDLRNQILELDKQMWQNGISRGDDIYIRILSRILNATGLQ